MFYDPLNSSVRFEDLPFSTPDQEKKSLQRFHINDMTILQMAAVKHSFSFVAIPCGWKRREGIGLQNVGKEL